MSNQLASIKQTIISNAPTGVERLEISVAMSALIICIADKEAVEYQSKDNKLFCLFGLNVAITKLEINRIRVVPVDGEPFELETNLYRTCPTCGKKLKQGVRYCCPEHRLSFKERENQDKVFKKKHSDFKSRWERKIKGYIKSGLSQVQMAEKEGVTRQAISLIIKNLGLRKEYQKSRRNKTSHKCRGCSAIISMSYNYCDKCKAKRQNPVPCVDCGTITVAGYRTKGRCSECYKLYRIKHTKKIHCTICRKETKKIYFEKYCAKCYIRVEQRKRLSIPKELWRKVKNVTEEEKLFNQIKLR